MFLNLLITNMASTRGTFVPRGGSSFTCWGFWLGA